MEIFVRNIPEHVPESNLQKAFAPILKDVGVQKHQFHCRKFKGRCGTLTLCDAQKGSRLLVKWPNENDHVQDGQLRLFGSNIYLSLSRNKPDEFLVRSLADEGQRKTQRGANSTYHDSGGEPPKRSFACCSFECGFWSYKNSNPIFIRAYHDSRKGEVKFGQSLIRVSLDDDLSQGHEVEFDYAKIVPPMHINEDPGNVSITLTVEVAPRFFANARIEAFSIEAMLANLNFRANNIMKERTTKLGSDDGGVFANCFSYRLTLSERADLRRILKLTKESQIPELTSRAIPTYSLSQSFSQSIEDGLLALQASSNLPYVVQFQLQRLLWHGHLGPTQVLQLSQVSVSLIRRHGLDETVRAIRSFARKLAWPSPEVDSSEFVAQTLAESLIDAGDNVGKDKHGLVDRLKPIQRSSRAWIHKAMVTPVGIYLEGPFWEPLNRVLRRYKKYSDYFIRVEFMDETGEPVTYDRNAKLDEIFWGRFKKVLQTGIAIGGRRFEFLGFSHSSLRSRSCWFMAPFSPEGEQSLNATNIIPTLGNFSKIRSPAKCAARIGQSFSETSTSITVPSNIVNAAQDVERNDRTFSDGCGTISAPVLYMIWKEYAVRAKVKPTVFQIRFAGAKGMLSLHHTQPQASVVLRPSMVKFLCENVSDIEICGSGLRPLPMYLNRQLIKILEDLGVPSRPFLELQKDELDRLRGISESPRRAANFLKSQNIPHHLKLPWFIKFLDGLGSNYANDTFLRKAVELAMVIQLRELKYRARIRVQEGVTLYGIMDETGYLQEGQIYCPTATDEKGRETLVQRRVVITRSPALHPGDVQLADAVDVPKHSPLRELHNCVVFSQHGARDLPSKLSGGDLDGDLYNIIWDERLTAIWTVSPADYPRVSAKPLDRDVVKDDIIDFFLIFMQQDQLGRIANAHLASADQKEGGTHDAECLKLAELHSTAVDFSKTGIPIDVKSIPRQSFARPDFMAPGPMVKVEKDLVTLLNKNDVDEDGVDDHGSSRQRYYMSQKVLGHLYRAIDEKSFLEKLERVMQIQGSESPTILESVWAYVSAKAVGFHWQHHKDMAKDIKEIYETNLEEIMYRYSATPWACPISELEVFVGNIIGKDKGQSRRQRESSMSMREDYESLLEFTVSQILEEEEPLERSIACLAIGLNDERDENGRTASLKPSGVRESNVEVDKQLRSFRYIAAACCAQEVAKFQKELATIAVRG